MVNICMHERIIECRYFPLSNFLVKVDDRILKLTSQGKSSLSPLGGTRTHKCQLTAPVTYNRVEQTLSTQLYSAGLIVRRK
jgi:hypothetical protein